MMQPSRPRSAFLLATLTTLLLIFSPSVIMAGPLLGCAWTYGTFVDGDVVRVNAFFSMDFRRFTNEVRFSQERWAKDIDMWKRAAARGDYQAESDYAVALMHLGQTEQALEILERLGREHPDEYIVAANLGTAYELAGQDEKAYQWIQRGIELNPDSHYGTEWLHLKILEAKLALAKDPDWLQQNNVLGYSFGTEARPVLPGELKEESERKRIKEALEYQLHERLHFVKAPDPVVADLLFDLANLMAFVGPLESARNFYDFAATYGPLRTEMIALRKGFIEKQIRWSAPERFVREHFAGAMILAALALLLALAAIYGIGRRFSRTGQGAEGESPATP